MERRCRGVIERGVAVRASVRIANAHRARDARHDRRSGSDGTGSHWTRRCRVRPAKRNASRSGGQMRGGARSASGPPAGDARGRARRSVRGGWAGIRAAPDTRIGACSAHATGTGVTQASLAITGLETSARSMQHGEPGACTGRLRSCPALRVPQQDPVFACEAEADVGAS